jgi:hypothetical protein
MSQGNDTIVSFFGIFAIITKPIIDYEIVIVPDSGLHDIDGIGP